MLFDWIAREGWIVLSWWALVTAAGAAALPLCLRVLGGLPDRGYTLARATGVLLVAFVFWLMTSFGLTLNTTGSMALAWVIVLIAGLALFFTMRRDERPDLRAWWQENRTVIIVGEVLFIVLLFGWAVVRAHQNGLQATEKPMELAFISATMRSETFPPNDPWMAGYGISYYYFGYIMAAMLSMLSGVPSTIGFNMTISLLFALTGITAYGVLYNMVRSSVFRRRRSRLLADDAALQDEEAASREPSQRTAAIFGVIGAVFVILLSNFQFPIIELPYQTRIASQEYLQFFGSNERMNVRNPAADTDLARWDYWWWFRSARVINDTYLDGRREEVIDEFPQFSFLLADVHPHVLALPFAALAIGAALNVLLFARAPRREQLVFYSLIIGGLIFLNTWDGPIYALVIVLAEGVRRLTRNGLGRLTLGDLASMFLLGAAMLGIGALLYLPFLIGFRSQLGGVLPNLVHPTLFQQFVVHFGPLLIILTFFLIVEAVRAGRRMNWGVGLRAGLGIVWLLIMIMLALTVIAWLVPDIRTSVLRYIEDSGGWGEFLPGLLTKRLTHSLTAIFLTLGLITVFARLLPRILARSSDEEDGDPEARHVVTYSPQTGFALVLVGVGILLTLAPEFVYLRDYFGTRMNTVFKLYYQAWLLWAIAAAFAVYNILADVRAVEVRPALRTVFSVALAIVLVLGFLYPVFGIHNRTMIETGFWMSPETAELTLDGGPRFTHFTDYDAAMCLSRLLASAGIRGHQIVVAEASGGSYQGEYGRTATLTGLPVVFNWPFHQLQWRGATFNAVAGTREQDIDRLYADPTWASAQEIIGRYSIDFIAFGVPERGRYGEAAETKFRDNLEPVCDNGGSRYYRVPESLQEAFRLASLRQ
jgi:YYY domain-containing protein